jgi:hypothetical protein
VLWHDDVILVRHGFGPVQSFSVRELDLAEVKALSRAAISTAAAAAAGVPAAVAAAVRPDRWWLIRYVLPFDSGMTKWQKVCDETKTKRKRKRYTLLWLVDNSTVFFFGQSQQGISFSFRFRFVSSQTFRHFVITRIQSALHDVAGNI